MEEEQFEPSAHVDTDLLSPREALPLGLCDAEVSSSYLHLHRRPSGEVEVYVALGRLALAPLVDSKGRIAGRGGGWNLSPFQQLLWHVWIKVMQKSYYVTGVEAYLVVGERGRTELGSGIQLTTCRYDCGQVVVSDRPPSLLVSLPRLPGEKPLNALEKLFHGRRGDPAFSVKVEGLITAIQMAKAMFDSGLVALLKGVGADLSMLSKYVQLLCRASTDFEQREEQKASSPESIGLLLEFIQDCLKVSGSRGGEMIECLRRLVFHSFPTELFIPYQMERYSKLLIRFPSLARVLCGLALPEDITLEEAAMLYLMRGKA